MSDDFYERWEWKVWDDRGWAPMFSASSDWKYQGWFAAKPTFNVLRVRLQSILVHEGIDIEGTFNPDDEVVYVQSVDSVFIRWNHWRIKAKRTPVFPTVKGGY